MLESKRRAIIFLTLSFLLALLAGFLFLKKIQQINAELGEMVEIYVASTDVASRSLIQPDQVTTRQLPKKYADDSYITDKASLKNKVTVVPLSEGDIITTNIIKPATIVRDQNNRLITVYASGRVIFDQQLEALDRVDIIVSHEVNGKQVTEVFMKDVPVAMVAKVDDQFKGVALELPFEQVPSFIHQQHYADLIRILKANVGKGELGIPQPFDQPPQQGEETSEQQPQSGTGDQAVTPVGDQANPSVNVPVTDQQPPANPDAKPEGQP
ncbi:flp pilus assembly protein CpaB [Brevibacillus humidisoli]|uniref:SAF domain-containing protein n=1 Tax=Brevibacillus humidisoli TaxID=2895522 RepID=UPI001E35A220|nr:SAF domain-containing protein [Brevibacillus humidisoli]UFJ39250.1 flp pilus assembly protein CpaB [Brevibacillus humidisoli]